MDVAHLNEKITFQKNSVEVDAIGNHKNGWSDYYACCKILILYCSCPYKWI